MSVVMLKSLGSERARRTGDARSWTPREMFEDLIRQSEAGEIDLSSAVVIMKSSSSTEDRMEASIHRAGVSIPDEFMLLRAAMARVSGLD